MYEYRSRPNYHRPWHKRVHAFVEPPVVPRRRTQSVDPLRRWSASLVPDGEHSNRYQNEPKYSNNSFNETLGGTSRIEKSPIHTESSCQKDPSRTRKMSNDEIDNILNNIRRSKSTVTKTGFGHDVLMSQKIPDPPGNPPPPLPSRRPSQEYASEYQRSPFGRHENVPPCVRRSRNREAKRSSANSTSFPQNNINTDTPQEPKVYSSTSHYTTKDFKPSTENLSNSSNNSSGTNLNQNTQSDGKRISVTEEEINSILENHRKKRKNSQSAFKIGPSRSPSVNDRVSKDNWIKNNNQDDNASSDSLNSSSTSTTEMLNKQAKTVNDSNNENIKNITSPPRRSRSKVKSQQIGTNDNGRSTRAFEAPQMNSSKLANFQNQFSNIDVKPNDGHAKDYTSTKNNTESNTKSKPTCVGVGNSETKNNNVIDYNMTPPTSSQLPEKPNKEVRANTSKNISRDGNNSLKNVAKNVASDASDNNVAHNKNINDGNYGFSTTSNQNNGSSPSSEESEQKDDSDFEHIINDASDDQFKWNNNPAFINDEENVNVSETSRNSIHSNYNDLLKNIKTVESNDGKKNDDFGKIPTDEGDKEVEEVLRDFRQRLDDMGEYIDRVKEAAEKLTDTQDDDMTKNDPKYVPPNKAPSPELIKEANEPKVTITEIDDTETQTRQDEKPMSNDNINDNKRNSSNRNSFIFSDTPFSFFGQSQTSPSTNDDIDTSTRMTIPITRMYPKKEAVPQHLTDDVENEIQNEGSVRSKLPSKLIGTKDQSYVPVNAYSSSQADQKKEEGNQLYKTKNYREALQRYSEAIELCPECPAFYGNRSACHMMLSQFTQALSDAKCSVELDSNFVKGYIRVSKCCVALGDAISAQQAIDKALQIEPNNAAALQEKSSIQQLVTYLADYNQAYQAKDYRKALFCLDRALSISSASRQLKISRAECLAFLGRYGEAQEVANDMLRLDNMNADAIYVRGLCLYNEDNVDKAFTHFQQVLRLAPDHVKAKEIYKKAKQLKQKKEEGNMAFKSGKLEDAYTLYSEALQIDPFNKFTNAKLFFNRATVAAKLKKLKESIQDCTSALELDEKYFKAILRRAKSYMDLEMYDEAVRDYESANKMDRGNQEVRQLLQQAKLELKKSKRKDYYKILGVGKDANDDEIKKAYRKRALVHHPDRHSSASEDERKEHEKKFKEIGEAYGVLSDAKKRNRYDQGHDIDDLEGHGHGYSSDIDPNQIFQAFFSQGGGGGAQHFTFGGQGGMPGGFSFQFG